MTGNTRRSGYAAIQLIRRRHTLELIVWSGGFGYTWPPLHPGPLTCQQTLYLCRRAVYRSLPCSIILHTVTAGVRITAICVLSLFLFRNQDKEPMGTLLYVLGYWILLAVLKSAAHACM